MGVGPPETSSSASSRPRCSRRSGTGKASQLGVGRKRLVDALRVERHPQRAHQRNAPTGVRHRTPDRAGDALVDRADEDDPHGLAVEPPVDELRVRRSGEVVERLAAHGRARSAWSTAASRSARSSSIRAWRFARSASLTNPFPESPTPTKIPITSATKTAASDATW